MDGILFVPGHRLLARRAGDDLAGHQPHVELRDVAEQGLELVQRHGLDHDHLAVAGRAAAAEGDPRERAERAARHLGAMEALAVGGHHAVGCDVQDPRGRQSGGA